MGVGEMSGTHFRRSIYRRNVLSAKNLSMRSPVSGMSFGEVSQYHVSQYRKFLKEKCYTHLFVWVHNSFHSNKWVKQQSTSVQHNFDTIDGEEDGGSLWLWSTNDISTTIKVLVKHYFYLKQSSYFQAFGVGNLSLNQPEMDREVQRAEGRSLKLSEKQTKQASKSAVFKEILTLLLAVVGRTHLTTSLLIALIAKIKR